MIELVYIEYHFSWSKTARQQKYALRCGERYFRLNQKHDVGKFTFNGWEVFDSIEIISNLVQNAQLQLGPSIENIVNINIIATFPNLNKLRKMKETHPELFI